MSFAGNVNSSSSVPSFFSSLHAVMVMAGTMNSSSSGNRAESWSSVARLSAKKASLNARNPPATTNATRNR